MSIYYITYIHILERSVNQVHKSQVVQKSLHGFRNNMFVWFPVNSLLISEATPYLHMYIYLCIYAQIDMYVILLYGNRRRLC